MSTQRNLFATSERRIFTGPRNVSIAHTMTLILPMCGSIAKVKDVHGLSEILYNDRKFRDLIEHFELEKAHDYAVAELERIVRENYDTTLRQIPVTFGISRLNPEIQPMYGTMETFVV